MKDSPTSFMDVTVVDCFSTTFLVCFGLWDLRCESSSVSESELIIILLQEKKWKCCFSLQHFASLSISWPVQPSLGEKNVCLSATPAPNFWNWKKDFNCTTPNLQNSLFLLWKFLPALLYFQSCSWQHVYFLKLV